MNCCGYFVCIVKWSKLESYLHNTNIWHHFWSTFRYLTPGVTIYRVTPYCLAINFEEISSYFVLNVFLWLLCIIKWSKLVNYLHNTNIWGHFWSKFVYLNPGVTIYRVTPTVFQFILNKYHHDLS
jgi:hypothetical protein